MYRFYEIKCPKCGHQFTWLEDSKDSDGNFYRRKGRKELLESTNCPKCNAKMVVLKESHSGIDIMNESIEIVPGFRGL